MKDGRPSLTANLVASVRALHNEMPSSSRLFEDAVAAELLPRWLAAPAALVRRAPGTAGAVERAARAVSLGLVEHVALRTRAIDDALRASLGDGARQVVLLGAGLDSRAERMPELVDVPVFEVDHPASHAFKVERLARRAPARRAPVARVAIDFERERLVDVLQAAGYDRAKPAFFIWEGVTVYLGIEAISETITALGVLAAPGSRVAVTYSTPADHATPRWLLPAARSLAAAVGEPLRGFITTEVLHTFFDRSGFDIVSDEDTATWSARYRPGAASPRSWERLAIAERRVGQASPRDEAC